MDAGGFEVTAEDVAEVRQSLEGGRTYARTLDHEGVRMLQRQLAQAMSDGRVENAGL